MKKAIIVIGMTLILITFTVAATANFMIDTIKVVSVGEDTIRLNILGEVNIYGYER